MATTAVMHASQTLPEVQAKGSSSSSMPPNRLTLESSERLSSGISLHTFSTSSDSINSFLPSGHIDLQFLQDLDPTRPSTSDADRQLTFTPAYVNLDTKDGHLKIMILARNGRVTQLLGLPRLQGPLQANVISHSGGFPEDVLRNLEGTVCIASGTGLAPFLAIGSTGGGYETSGVHLLWTINGSDFQAVEFLLNSGLLKPDNWASVKLFVTSGEEVQGLPAGKAANWWQDKFSSLKIGNGENIDFKLGRMSNEDVFASNLRSTTSTVLFCGNKSLEWQVKMWFLNKAQVYTASVDWAKK